MVVGRALIFIAILSFQRGKKERRVVIDGRRVDARDLGNRAWSGVTDRSQKTGLPSDPDRLDDHVNLRRIGVVPTAGMLVNLT